MAIETKICTRCSKEKEITSFEKRNNNHYYRRRCNECHSQREEKARKKREKWEKIKKPPKIFKIFKEEKLKGSFKKYYSFFCDIRECGARKNYIISKLKNEFKLNKNYATQLADQFESGNIEKIILDYADPS